MLILDNNSNPKFSIMYISSLILKQLKETQVISFDQLKLIISSSLCYNVNDLFIYSLSFLFILGKIEYLSNKDEIKLIS